MEIFPKKFIVTTSYVNFFGVLLWIFALVIVLQPCVGSFYRFFFCYQKLMAIFCHYWWQCSVLLSVVITFVTEYCTEDIVFSNKTKKTRSDEAMILTSETLAIKLVSWVAPEWFLKASLEHQKNFRNFLFEMSGVQLAMLHFFGNVLCMFFRLNWIFGLCLACWFWLQITFRIGAHVFCSGLLEVLAGPFTTT